jgi:hypothetical protein
MDYIALNLFKLLGIFLLNRHYSKLRALNGLPIIVSFLKLYKSLIANLHVFIVFGHCQNLCKVILELQVHIKDTLAKCFNSPSIDY